MGDERRQEEEEAVARRTAPSGLIVYHAIYNEAEHELERDVGGLAWSGLAAGLSMGFSMLFQAMLRAYMPDSEWISLITPLGYTVGFLIVILGRQQLFTENTLTPVLPLLNKPQWSTLLVVGRLWIVVLITNLIGGFLFAAGVAWTDVVDVDVRHACLEVGREAMRYDFDTTLIKGIIAGWLIAMMVWLLPFAESARVGVIIIITYVVGLGHFSHIIAGGVKVFYLVAAQEISLLRCFTGYIIPTLIGNVIGGVALVAALAHAQFKAGEQDKRKESDALEP